MFKIFKHFYLIREDEVEEVRTRLSETRESYKTYKRLLKIACKQAEALRKERDNLQKEREQLLKASYMVQDSIDELKERNEKIKELEEKISKLNKVINDQGHEMFIQKQKLVALEAVIDRYNSDNKIPHIDHLDGVVLAIKYKSERVVYIKTLDKIGRALYQEVNLDTCSRKKISKRSFDELDADIIV